MFTAQEHQLVLEILNKRRAWLLNQIKDPNLEYNQVEQYKSMDKVLSTAIAKVNEVAPDPTGNEGQGEKLDLSHLRVLVVEDDRSSTELLREILEDLGIEQVESASDGNEALTKLFQSEEIYNLVLCDWNMPGKGGLEVHATLKTDKRFKDIIFILVSSIADGEQIRTAIVQGVNDYVVKPIDESVLKRKIVNAYQKKFANSQTAH